MFLECSLTSPHAIGLNVPCVSTQIAHICHRWLPLVSTLVPTRTLCPLSQVQYNGDLNEHAKFRNFGVAFITLFRFSTGENWNGFMYNVAYAGLGGNGVLDDDDDCVVDPEYDKQLCGFNDFPGLVRFML